MIKQLKSEWYKLWRYLWTYVMIGIYALLFFVYIGAMEGLRLMTSGDPHMVGKNIGFFVKVYKDSYNPQFYEIVRTSFSFSIFLALAILVFVIMFFSMEDTSRTINNSLIRGQGKIKVYGAKVIIIMTFSCLLYSLFIVSIFVLTLLEKSFLLKIDDGLLFVKLLLCSNAVLMVFILISIVIYIVSGNVIVSGAATTILTVMIGSSYMMKFARFDNVNVWETLYIKAYPVYYWQNLCAYRITKTFMEDLVGYCQMASSIFITIGSIVIWKKERK